MTAGRLNELRLPRRRSASLSFRLVGVFGLLVASAVLLVAGTTTMVMRARFAHTLDVQLRGTAQSFRLGPAARSDGATELAVQTQRWLADHPLPVGQMAAVRIAGGRVFTSAGNLDMFEVPSPRSLLNERSEAWWNLHGSEGPVRGLTLPIASGGHQVGTLVLLAYRRPLDRTLAALLAAMTRASVIGLVVALLLGGLVVIRTLRPLRAIAAEVSAIEQTGDLARRVYRADAPGELGRLATAFDRMLATLEESFRSQRRFVADASHELRTPLTVVRGQLELLASRLDGPRRELVSQTEQELDRMALIVGDLLLLAHLDEGMRLRSEPVELELVVREALLRAMLLAPRATRVEAEPGLYACADGARLLQVLTNLVANAVKNTGEEDEIRLAASSENGHALLRVSDTGCGIAARDLPHVFERFYRAPDRRARTPEGSGLGLAIAASLTDAMHGAITVASRPTEGTTFTIELPLWRNATRRDPAAAATRPEEPIARTAPASSAPALR